MLLEVVGGVFGGALDGGGSGGSSDGGECVDIVAR